jgi:NDP-sugar pyrophosphorylase family protein
MTRESMLPSSHARCTGMILAAGHGTRLRPLTFERPKPLVPIGDRTVLAHAAANLAAFGVKRVVINTHHLADQYDADALQDELKMQVLLNHEVDIRGTAGGIHAARELLGDGPVVVHNGDILADLDVAMLVAKHREHAALATLALLGGSPPGVGPVGLDRNGEIARLRDQRFGDENEGAQFIGVHIVSAALRERLPADGCMVGDTYIPALHAGERIVAAKVVRSYTDVGTPRAYLDANLRWLEQRGESVYRGPDVTIADGVEVVDSVVGAGATVVGVGQITQSVIWPGARAEAPLRNAVVTTAGKVLQEIAPGGN